MNYELKQISGKQKPFLVAKGSILEEQWCWDLLQCIFASHFHSYHKLFTYRANSIHDERVVVQHIEL